MGMLEGRVAIVSGGARGMGAAEVELFASEGAHVVAGDVLDAEGQALAEGLGDAVRYVHLDVTQEGDWAAAVSAAEEAFGPVSALVNNAGIVLMGPLEQTSLEDFHRVIGINLVGVFLGIRSVIPSMRRAGGGAIVNISSTAGLMGYSGIPAYVASKWGVRGLTKAAALELSADGIRVNSIHPGPIRTPMTDGMGDEMVTTQPIPRWGEPIEVARMALFLASDMSSFSTGSEFVVDGGAVTGQVPPVQEG